MSVNVQTSLDQHGLTADEQMAVFAYMNRSQQVNAYEVQQLSLIHISEPTRPY